MTRASVNLASLSLLIVASFVSAPTPTCAQEDPPQVAEARQHFDEGSTHFEAGRFALAADAFQRAYALLAEIDHPRANLLLFNVGRSLEAIGRDAEARDAYARFLASSPDQPELVAQVNQQIAELDARLAATADSPAEEPAVESARESLSPVGPIMLGVGAAAVATGLILGAVGLAQDGDVGAMCPSRMDCPETLRGQYEDAQTLALAGDVLWIAGATIAATGLILTLLLGEGGDETTGSAWCVPGGCGLALDGTF
ncbi:MAG: tetratricopeptide repeat protein [Sandaracinaceae bacterium]